MKHPQVAKILLEEAIRAMALFGVLLFGVVVHLVRLFDVPAAPAVLGALGVALLGFVESLLCLDRSGRLASLQPYSSSPPWE